MPGCPNADPVSRVQDACHLHVAQRSPRCASIAKRSPSDCARSTGLQRTPPDLRAAGSPSKRSSNALLACRRARTRATSRTRSSRRAVTSPERAARLNPGTASSKDCIRPGGSSRDGPHTCPTHCGSSGSSHLENRPPHRKKALCLCSIACAWRRVCRLGAASCSASSASSFSPRRRRVRPVPGASRRARRQPNRRGGGSRCRNANHP